MSTDPADGAATDPAPADDRAHHRLRRAVRRLPLRLRLVAGFAAAMTVVLTGSGAFVYWRVDYALDRRLDTDLAAGAADLQALLTPAGTLPAQAATDSSLSDFQVLGPNGEVVSRGPGLGTTPLLDGTALAQARQGATTVDVGSLLPISPRPLRLLAQPLQPGSTSVLVVAVSRGERDEALRELIAQLALAGLGTLLVTTVVGERLAKAALSPVERYRAQARTIAAGATGVRLDVPADRDDEITRLGATLNEMLGSLEESVARERRFVDDASHELRTPLTLLLTRVQLTLRRPRSPAEHEAVLRELHTDLTQLAELAESLLALGTAAGSAKPGDASPGPTGDVAGVARALADAGVLGEPARSWDLQVPSASTIADTTVVGLSDSAVRQVLLNLLTNAHVHGSPPVQVTVRHEAADGREVVVLTVTDHGPGVPPDFLPTAIERFRRTSEARARPGAGLGLSLVHALVAAAGGELRLCSRGVHHRYEQRFAVACEHPAQGTTASILLTSVLLASANTAPRR